MKTLLPDAKTTRYNAGWLGIAGVPETWRQYRLFTKSLQLTSYSLSGFILNSDPGHDNNIY